MKKHTKHTALVKPLGGSYHLTELGFIGAPCSIIQQLCLNISIGLEEKLKLGYMDADHKPSSAPLVYHATYTDKIKYNQVNNNDNHTEYSLRAHFNTCDALLINANHFNANQQIVIINAKKKESLSRKLDRLTNLKAIILDEGVDSPFDFVIDHLTKQKGVDYKNIPQFSILNKNKIVEFILNTIQTVKPELKGLLLYGGKSTRMGKDKGKIAYHGMPQVQYLSRLLSDLCSDTYVSVLDLRPELPNANQIEDTFKGLGPFGGIVSAFRKNPNCAYLTLPCDVPFIDKTLIQLLIRERDSSKMATCFHNPDTDFPEPLITIWEPRAYPQLLHFLSLGYSCPRKVLINSDIKQINPPHHLSLYNANTPEELAFAKAQISHLNEK
ncbi:MAG: molybdenum cofactor guanylyltransferase [Saprospiraceae bacterium]